MPTLECSGYRSLTSQLFIAGEPGNARDGLYRRLGPQSQALLTLELRPAQVPGLRWQVVHTLVLASA